MRTLRFIVDGQKIMIDPSCNFKGIVAGTKGYLKAKFKFSTEWQQYQKAGKFVLLKKEYFAPIVNNECLIPEEALTWNNFYVGVIGLKGKEKIVSNLIKVNQEVN